MSISHVTVQQLEEFRNDFDALRRELGKVVVAQQQAVDGILTAIIAGGHVLLEGAPGLGKTLLAGALAEATSLSLQRIQFTPDLMPSDVIGTYVVMETAQGRRTFEFQQGPLFANVVLADHINRGTPKTQSALLEAMEGDSVSVSSERFRLPQPFFVLATQNPLEMEGTFPLPEPQIDRFFFKLLLHSPSCDQIEQILDRTTEGAAPQVRPIVDGQRILQMRAVARQVPIARDVRRWAIALTAATHPDDQRAPETVRQFVQYGSSPRGAQALVLAAKIQAVAGGRDYVSLADLRGVAHAALRHRVILNLEAQAENVRPERLIDNILEAVPPPSPAAEAAPRQA